MRLFACVCSALPFKADTIFHGQSFFVVIRINFNFQFSMNANGLAVEFEWVRKIRAQFTQMSDKCNDIPEQEKTCIKQIH